MNNPNSQNGRPQRANSPQGGGRSGQRPQTPSGRPVSNASPNRPQNNPQRRSNENRQRNNPGPQTQRGATAAQRPSNSSNPRNPMKPKKGLFSKKPASKKPQSPQQKPQKPNTTPQRKPAPQQSRSSEPVVNKKASAAAAKAMNTKHAAPARNKFKGGSYILYYLLLAIVLVVVMIILANTVLFNCKQIEVNGVQRYLPDQIIEVSRIRKGDNLLHVDKDKAAEKIVSELAYVESAKVETSFPTKIIITVTEAEKWYCIDQFGVKAVISRGGKILEKGSSQGLVVVTGYEAASLETGSRLSSKVEGKQTIPEQILNAADKAGVTNIDSIDMTDRYSISMVVDGRIKLELGDITDIETKMLAAYVLIEEKIAPHENVTVLLTNPEKIAVHTNRPEEQPDASEPEASNSGEMSNKPENSTSGE